MTLSTVDSGVVPLPRSVARFNKRFTNRFAEPLARRFSNFAIVHHQGRRSGASFKTPVNVFASRPDRVIVALTYGPKADWVRNVQAGGGSLQLDSRVLSISTATLLDREMAWPYLPRPVRLVLTALRVHDFLELTVTPLDTSL